jgi:ABC transporter
VLDRDVENLSGGELQRFAIAVVATQEADVYMIDEPSSYLDVRQRLKAAQVGKGAKAGEDSEARGFRVWGPDAIAFQPACKLLSRELLLLEA